MSPVGARILAALRAARRPLHISALVCAAFEGPVPRGASGIVEAAIGALRAEGHVLAALAGCRWQLIEFRCVKTDLWCEADCVIEALIDFQLSGRHARRGVGDAAGAHVVADVVSHQLAAGHHPAAVFLERA